MSATRPCTQHGDTLTFGCDVCIARVKADQEAARIAELPLREMSVECGVRASEMLTVTVKVNAEADADADRMVERAEEAIWDQICRLASFDPDDYDIVSAKWVQNDVGHAAKAVR